MLSDREYISLNKTAEKVIQLAMETPVTSVADSTPGKKQVYTPHLKKVLRSFQASAHTSLHGPNSVMGVWNGGNSSSTMNKSLLTDSSAHGSSLSSVSGTASVNNASSHTSSGPSPSVELVATSVISSVSGGSVVSPKSPEDDPFTAPPPFPIQQPPIFTPPDQSGCEKSETVLENETISCFTVGGEKRLCLPQILNTVLRDFSLQQINCICDSLHIFCSRCTSEQLEVLKNTSVLPLSAPSCGLITKSDAERLCSALLDSNPPKVVQNPDAKSPFQVQVYHECFGRCIGLYVPDLYMDPMARCVECAECHGLFSLQKFVCHTHHPKENRTCHWGFDSFNWRCYVLLDNELESDPHLVEVFKEMKSRYDFSHDYNNHKYKRKQILCETKDPSKKLRVENFYPYSCPLDPALVYWYPNHTWNKVTTFKPMPSVISRNEKSFFMPPETLPHFLKDRSPYFLHDPSFLTSDHPLPIRETDRFETHYQATVKYGPVANIHKLTLRKSPYSLEDTVHVTKQQTQKTLDTTHCKQPTLKKERNYNASCCFDSEDTFSDTSSSTLSAGTDDSLVLTFEDEEEPLSPLESQLLPLTSLLKENCVDSSLSSKIIFEVEAIVTKHQKCLKTNIKNKKHIHTEFENVHRKQRDKIRKLRETCKYLEKEMMALQTSMLETSDEKKRTAECQNSEKQLLPSPKSNKPESSENLEDTHDDKTRADDEKDNEKLSDNTEANITQPKLSLVEIKIEPDSK